jgi:acyl dehydratase
MSTNFDLMPDIDEAAYAEIAAFEGEPIRIEQWNQESSWDSIRHYSLGLGDDNPLYCDPAYAEATPYGTLLAPPTFPYTIFDGAIGRGMPGVQPIYAGTEWTFHKRLTRNKALSADATFGRVKRTKGGVAQDIVLQATEVAYKADGEVFAEAVANTFRIARRGASTGLAYDARDAHLYSDAEYDALMDEAEAEYRRGAAAAEGIEVGEAVPALVKGPIGKIDMTAYYMGCPGSPGYKSVEMAWKYRRWATTHPERLPNNYDPSYFGERVLPSLGHQDAAAAHELGMPGAYNNGPQRCGWFAHCVSNWMGDGAFLRNLSIRLARPEIFGDLIHISGEVTSIDNVDGLPGATVSLRAENQLGEQTATAEAKVQFDDYGRARG